MPCVLDGTRCERPSFGGSNAFLTVENSNYREQERSRARGDDIDGGLYTADGLGALSTGRIGNATFRHFQKSGW